jgi:putative ABC transport system permease protein
MDSVDAAPVVIVDDLLAATTWPNQGAVGKKLTVERFQAGDFIHSEATVVGVIRHIQHHSLSKSIRGQIYIPYPQSAREHLSFAVRAKTDPWAIAPAVRREVAQIDKNLAIAKVRPMTDYLSRASAPVSFEALIASIFGALGLLLAAVGVYSVTSYSMSQRSHEMAVRAAVGAKRSDIIGLAVREGLLLVLGGTVLGVGCALMLSQYLQSLLFGVKAADPATYLIVASVLSVAAILACWAPALRFSRQSILQALRLE